MIDITTIDYSKLDRPEILMFLFHPRPDWNDSDLGEGVEDITIPVDESVVLGARLFSASASAPNILFFHGNGEIVADYDDVGQYFRRMDINFVPVDYRGYGRSTGEPTVTAMMRDCHVVFDYMNNFFSGRGHDGPLVVMGRSLGSASALELSACYGDRIDGLIIESGFAHSAPLMDLLGFDMQASGIREEDAFRNEDKIRSFLRPTLIIHAEYDHLIPFTEGQALYNASSAPDKRLFKVAGANHNDIFFRGAGEYLDAVKELTRAAGLRK